MVMAIRRGGSGGGKRRARKTQLEAQSEMVPSRYICPPPQPGTCVLLLLVVGIDGPCRAVLAMSGHPGRVGGDSCRDVVEGDPGRADPQSDLSLASADGRTGGGSAGGGQFYTH